MAAARRSHLGHVRRLIERRVVNPGTRFEEFAHRRALLDPGQARRIIVDAEFVKRAVEVDQVIRHCDANQGTEQALAD